MAASGLAQRIRTLAAQRREILVVLDDDPTGSQCVRGVPVITGWDDDDLDWAMSQSPRSPFFVLTNSRSRCTADAVEMSEAIGHATLAAAARHDLAPVFLSRSDSTLRGHFPAEIAALQRVLELDRRPIDGVLLCPAFPEAGRVTIDDTHWVKQGDELVPAATTEFAADAAFGYQNSHLPAWVEERTAGEVRAADVRSVSLDDIRRGGPQHVASLLASAGGIHVINAVTSCDLDVVALGALLAETAGHRFLYRVGPSFVRARAGQEATPPVRPTELFDGAEREGRGLVIVGSHTDVTTRQLTTALERHDLGHVELNVERILDPRDRHREIQRVLVDAGESLARRDAVVSTSRMNATPATAADDGLDIAREVSRALVEVVRHLADSMPLRYIVTKGGITSSDIATKALGIRRAHVVGQMIGGGIPVWRATSEAERSGLPLIIFPGNVGDDRTLADLLNILTQNG